MDKVFTSPNNPNFRYVNLIVVTNELEQKIFECCYPELVKRCEFIVGTETNVIRRVMAAYVSESASNNLGMMHNLWNSMNLSEIVEGVDRQPIVLKITVDMIDQHYHYISIKEK